MLDSLNSAQRLAVTTTEGPVMVMAGAGSGKTKVLTTRISYLIKELNVSPQAILAVTFTNKAANEMKDRIGKMLNINTNYMWISTFHSFCCRLLRIEMNNLPPFTNKFVIVDDEDSNKIVKNIMKEAEIDSYKPKEIRNLISKSKNFLDYKIDNPDLRDVFTLVNNKYQEYLEKQNLLDFDDLIIKTIELFKKNPDILEKYQRRFQYVLVDEFQDTNTLQYNLMFMLSQRYHNIFVVGDDFQSIYSFRGAKIENINRFRHDFLEHKLILLEENYRSTTQILDLANSVIEKNPNQIKKVMFSNNKDGEKPFYYQADSYYDEVMFVIDKIQQLIGDGYKYSDIAIMYRANYVSRNFEDMLVRKHIPYVIYGGLSFFARKEIKDMVAYLRLLVNPDDNFSFERVINEPKRKIGPSLLQKLYDYASFIDESHYKAIETYDLSSGMAVDALRQFKKTLDTISAQIENVKLPDLIDILLKETLYKDALQKDDNYEDRYQNIQEFKSVLKEAEEFYEGTNKEKLETLLSDLALRTENDNESKKATDTVKLTTYHQAKGLEFRCVFMVAMEEEIFPSMNCQSDSDIEEERRICYVGITRAKEQLYITNAKTRYLFGCERSLSPSRFVREMNKDLLRQRNRFVFKTQTSQKSSTTSVFKTKTTTTQTQVQEAPVYKIGDKVNHKLFGDGLIVKIEGNTLSIAFQAPHGIKKLLAGHPSFRKI